MKKLMILAVAMVAMAMGGKANATYLQVDDFEDGTIGLTNVTMASPFADTQASLPGVLGGSRFIQATADADFGKIALNIPLDSPKPSLSMQASTTGLLSTTITYDNRTAANVVSGLGGVDLFTDGALGFLLQVMHTDDDAKFTFAVTDIDGKTKSLSVVAPEIGSSTTIYFDFASFTGDAGTNFALANKITLTITQSPATDDGLDWTITRITTGVVPEPTSLALAGFAGIGMAVGAIRRRRQAKQAA